MRAHEQELSGRQSVSQDDKLQLAKAKEGGGLLRHVLGLGVHGKPGNDAQSQTTKKSSLDLADIQGFIVRGYRMPLVRHFLLTVSVPARRANCLDGSSAETKPTPHKSPLPKIGMWVLSPGPTTTPRNRRAGSPTIV